MSIMLSVFLLTNKKILSQLSQITVLLMNPVMNDEEHSTPFHDNK